MNREEALCKFQEEIAVKLEQVKLKLIEQYVLKEEKFQERISESISQLCKKITRPVNYFQISLLRCLIGQGVFRIMISAHDDNYFLDSDMYVEFFDADTLFSELEELKQELFGISRNYNGRIQYYDVDFYIVNLAMDFFKSQGGKFRSYFKDFDQWECICTIPKGSRLVVKWGEHREYSETVFLMDMSSKTQEQFEEKNIKNQLKEWDNQYICQGWDMSGFLGFRMCRKNFMFINMRSCRLKDCRWDTCLIVGGVFRQSEFEQVTFRNCDLSLSDFRNAQLKQVGFIQCNLSNSDFTGAKMQEVKFTDSKMEGAVFSRQALAYTGLDAIQLQQLKVEEMPYVFYNGG